MSGKLSGASSGGIPKDIIEKAYPVGTVYTSIQNTNPATLFGVGTWELLAPGKVIVGCASESSASKVTGGEKTSLAEIYAHNHPMNHNHAVASHSHTFSHAHTMPRQNVTGARSSSNGEHDHSSNYESRLASGSTNTVMPYTQTETTTGNYCGNTDPHSHNVTGSIPAVTTNSQSASATRNVIPDALGNLAPLTNVGSTGGGARHNNLSYCKDFYGDIQEFMGRKGRYSAYSTYVEYPAFLGRPPEGEVSRKLLKFSKRERGGCMGCPVSFNSESGRQEIYEIRERFPELYDKLLNVPYWEDLLHYAESKNAPAPTTNPLLKNKLLAAGVKLPYSGTS